MVEKLKINLKNYKLRYVAEENTEPKSRKRAAAPGQPCQGSRSVFLKGTGFCSCTPKNRTFME